MNTQSINSNLLVDELQLGEQLNHCVHNERRSDFALMLSMLTDDVRAHSQFKLPLSSNVKLATTEQQLRKSLELPEPLRLSLSSLDDIDEFSLAHFVENKQLESVHLSQALKPAPLSFRDDKLHVDTNVMANTTLYCQQQHKSRQSDQQLQRMSFNANEWLKVIQTSLVKAPLIDTNV